MKKRALEDVQCSKRYEDKIISLVVVPVQKSGGNTLSNWVHGTGRSPLAASRYKHLKSLDYLQPKLLSVI